MDKKILIIDGDSLLHIVYNGSKKSKTYTEDGMPNYFIRSFIYSFSKYIKELDIDDTVFVFDSKEDTFRHILYDGYKGDRTPRELEMAMQETIIHSIIEKSGFKSFIIDGYEGDDVVASVALKAVDLGYKEVIVGTGDKDMYQIITDTIKVYNFNKKVTVTKENILEHFEVPVEQVVSYLCLLGDKADCVAGVEGVGATKAVRLLNHFGNFVAIFDNIDEVCYKELKIGKAVWDRLVHIKNTDDAIIDLNIKMITLVDDLNVGDDFTTIECQESFESIVSDLDEFEINGGIDFKRFYGRY